MKYEMIFGDEGLFDGAPEYATHATKGGGFYFIDTGVVKFISNVGLGAMDVCEIAGYLVAERRIIKTPVQHSDDIAVDLFAAKMKEKLEKSRDKGRSGWESCTIEHLINGLKEHIDKGDPVDVANFAMMISQRGESIKTPVWTVEDQKAGRLPEVGCKAMQRDEYCTVDILSVHHGYIVVCNSDIDDSRPTTFEIKLFLELFNPIETPEERAQRLRSEWVKHALVLYMSSPKNDFASMGDVYDALLSGELQAPKGE